MGQMLDIIGFLVIRGAIALAVLNLSYQLHIALYKQSALAETRANSITPVQIMDDDLSMAKTFVVPTNSTEATFSSYIDATGTAAATHYYVAGSSPDMILYRSVSSIDGGAPKMIGKKLKSIELKYYDRKGISTAVLANIKLIRLRLSFETDVNRLKLSYGATDSSGVVFWERNIVPPNLQ